jgi:uncharacterized UBP type Zn finger protein
VSLLRVLRRGRERPDGCTHRNAIRDVEPDADGCSECLAIGDSWLHLRLCMTCGHVGCCDSSKNHHATRHAEAAGHPIFRSFEQGETWMWCVLDRTYVG